MASSHLADPDHRPRRVAPHSPHTRDSAVASPARATRGRWTMSPYLFIHRIKGPAMLVVFGITALLHEWDILTFGRSWPLYLIVLGVLQLAERAAWSQYQQQYVGGA